MNAFDEMNKGEQDPANDRVAFVQWKGSNVCMDVQCECGVDVHLDSAEFAYFLHCPECDRFYGVCPNVRLIPIRSLNAISELRDGGNAVIELYDADS